MKKLVLAGGGTEGLLQLAPLYAALKKSASCDPVALLPAEKDGDAVSRELAGCFGIDGSCRTIEPPDGTPVERLASLLTWMEKVIASEKPVLVIVCGNDDTALAAALAASRLSLPVASVDAGLRNYERTDAHEVNRVLIDALAGLHFVSEHSGAYNLINEGVPDEKVFFAGSLLIDSLAGLMQLAGRTNAAARHGLEPKQYAMVVLGPSGQSLHPEHTETIHRLLTSLSGKITVLMPLAGEQRTLPGVPGIDRQEALKTIDRPGPGELLTLLRDSALLLTDIEELQAESTVMDVPCLTMMDRTFRPSTVEIGSNILVGYDEEEILDRIEDILRPDPHGHRTGRSKIPEKWDGAAASRIVAVLDRVL